MDNSISQSILPETGKFLKWSQDEPFQAGKHHNRNIILSAYPLTDRAGLQSLFAVMKNTFKLMSENDRLIEDVAPDGEFKAEVREQIQQTNDCLEGQRASSRAIAREANKLQWVFIKIKSDQVA